MSVKFNNISFIKYRGYGTFLENYFINFFSDKFYIFRDFTKRQILTKSGNYSYPNYKETYLEVCKDLDVFYKHLNKEKLTYKNVNILEIAKRNLNQKLIEFKNNIHQLKEFQKEKQCIYKVEYKLFELLKIHNVNCKISVTLTILYFILDLAYFAYSKLRILNEIKLDKILYERKNSELGINIFAADERFLKLLKHLDSSFNPFLLMQEKSNIIDSKWSQKNYKKSKNLQKKIIYKRYKSLSTNFKKNCLTIDSGNLFKFNINNLDEQITQNISNYLLMIDTYDDVYSEIKPTATIVGINSVWINNILIQLAEFHKSKIIYFQDFFHFEDYFFDGLGAIFTSSKTYKKDLIKYFGKKDDEIHVSYNINNFLANSPIDLIKSAEQFSYEEKIEFKNKYGIDEEKKIVLIAADPGDTVNSKEHKFISEYYSLLEIRDCKDYQTIIKLHPQDKTLISKLAQRYADNKNVIVSSDIDIYKCLILSDIVISKYSTVVWEALTLKKFVILTNFEDANYYKQAVKYKVAHFANRPNDIKKLILDLETLMNNFDHKLNTYLSEVYSSNSDVIDLNKSFKKVINNDIKLIN